YGHFSNRDTAGGGFALGVRRSLHQMAFGIARGGAAGWYNPAWLFVVAFDRVFLRISQGASRLQGILAGRWAAFAYGSSRFIEGLRHVIEQDVRFNRHVEALVGRLAVEKKPLTNLYDYPPAVFDSTPEVDKAIDELIHRQPSAYDSHPSPANRF